MGFVFTKLAYPVRWVLDLPGNLVSKKEDPRSYYLQHLALLEKGEQDDYKAALALERGKPLPPPTKAQLEMSKASFSEMLEKFLVADTIARRPQSEVETPRVTRSKKGEQVSVECVVCRDKFDSIGCLDGPCGHFFCRQCVIATAEIANKHEDLFPLQCCQQQLPMDVFLGFLDVSLRTTFVAKCAEAATPPNARVYCPNKTCLKFIGRTPASAPCVMSCPECRTDVCTGCKYRAHPGESCDDMESREVRALAEAKGWKACPRCKIIVERIDGCSHIQCRCRKDFCYNCGKKWASCKCGYY